MVWCNNLNVNHLKSAIESRGHAAVSFLGPGICDEWAGPAAAAIVAGRL